ncbi:dinitrogenase iron-molybdenum cofactor biosynthesis protein [Nitratidesulfovibrio sp. HK-II]
MNAHVCLACYEDRLATLLETAAELRCVRMTGGVPMERTVLSVPDGGPTPLIDVLSRHGVSLLVCGGIRPCWRSAVEMAGIAVLPWLSGSEADVLSALARGRPDALAMPGCRPHRARGVGARRGGPCNTTDTACIRRRRRNTGD